MEIDRNRPVQVTPTQADRKPGGQPGQDRGFRDHHEAETEPTGRERAGHSGWDTDAMIAAPMISQDFDTSLARNLAEMARTGLIATGTAIAPRRHNQTVAMLGG